jgi:hypothetical protein
MIGFLFNGVKRTMRLPAKKALAYIKETHTILHRKAILLKSIQAIVRRLRHASVILPAAKGFFTPINTALWGNPKIVGLGANLELRAALEVWGFLQWISMLWLSICSQEEILYF